MPRTNHLKNPGKIYAIQGAPSYDHSNAQFFSNLSIPVFACTPDKFPDLMAAALSKQDIALWAAKEELALKK